MNFETTIGLEVHVEMKTKSKAFSPAPVQYGAEQNTNTNVIDWGYPGVLPEVNKGALEFGMRAALALNCEITKDIHFDRKNYFYPDNPKAYQITQAQTPIGTNGWLEIELEDGSKKKIGIEEMHVEEDAGKNTHNPDGYSYVDLNRQGTPLIEIVSKPDIASPAEAYAYLTR
ncbi:MAG: Asp-tRNA(Asn)/Glu-tRNA(Gln) amidotransferase GatCAB subunit B, partial [Ligilactobacillus agilis]|nr:Asp-tRNA(Asn)/Glu-tRNA(Gln) amidotransferase GatCAB subunit B [Ligilactobacillus agilis]